MANVCKIYMSTVMVYKDYLLHQVYESITKTSQH